MTDLSKFCGIDYGSKLACTTVIAHFGHEGKVRFTQSEKKRDADQLIVDFLREQNAIRQVFIDAPLSLPQAYRTPQTHSDYFYRQADKELKAMSPLFLGGLTARAMQLAYRCRTAASFHEVYPGGLADHLGIKPLGYKKNMAEMEAILEKTAAFLPAGVRWERPVNWHQMDALLAWVSGFRFLTSRHQKYGNEDEGWILI